MTTYGELFEASTPYEFSHRSRDKDHHDYSFKTSSGARFDVEVHHAAGNAHVSFRNEWGDTHVTGEHRGEASRIVHTVNHIVRQHVKNNPDVRNVTFSADTREQSRVKLYDRITARHGARTATYGNTTKRYDVPVR